jgi:hypothetical protein
MNIETIIQLCAAVVLFLTLIAAIIYAWASIKLWKESVKQTRLIMRPIIIITHDESESKFKYVNFGNTPAFNISIEDITLIDSGGFNFTYIFPTEHILPQQKEMTIENIKKKVNGLISDTDTFDLGALIPYSANRSFDVAIRYENSENEKFITEGIIGVGAFEFTRIKRAT